MSPEGAGGAPRETIPGWESQTLPSLWPVVTLREAMLAIRRPLCWTGLLPFAGQGASLSPEEGDFRTVREIELEVRRIAGQQSHSV